MKLLSAVTTTALTFLALTSFSSAQPATQEERLVEFNAPGAAKVSSPACAPNCGTVAYDNNDLGEIVGYYTDAKIVPHGFLRFPNGHITSFDAPGAGLGHGLNQGTDAYAIDDLGEIAGQFQDPSYVFYGFVRYPNGSFTTFDEPDAGTEATQGTQAFNINLRGTTAGIYIDASNVYHGFVRSPSNAFTSVDPTGSVFTYVCEETCLNPDGTVAGFYTDRSGVTHGFVRHANGTITSIDAPAPVGLTTLFTEVASINAKGEIAGLSLDSNFVAHGFVRHRDGSFTTFDHPEAGTGMVQGTAPYSINLGGATTGQYIDASNNAHGFERFPDGEFANFDAPDAAPSSMMTFGLFGTRPSTNNAEGEVAGWYMDAGGLNHGFFWIPGTPEGYAVSTLTPGQSEAVSSATVPDPALAISRLPLPEKIRELILRRALIGGLGAPGSQPQ